MSLSLHQIESVRRETQSDQVRAAPRDRLAATGRDRVAIRRHEAAVECSRAAETGRVRAWR